MSQVQPIDFTPDLSPSRHGGQGFSLWRERWDTFAASETGSLIRSFSLMIVTYLGVRTLLFKGTKLPEAAYFLSSITGAMLLRWPSALALVAVSYLVWQGWSRLRWAELDQGQALRCFIGVLAGTLAWTFSVYDYNLYYGQGHYLDRLLLVGLFIGSLWRPVLVAPFLLLVYAIVHQFDQPLACTWTDKRVLFDLLSLFVTFLCVRLWQPRTWPQISANDFLFLTIVLQAANYVFPGVGKVLMGWPLVERLDNLFIASYLNGWWGHLTTDQALGWAKFLAAWNQWMVWPSLIVELSAVFCLWNRRACMLILASCVGLHTIICLTTGILFWKWIVFDVAIIGLLMFRDRATTDALFAPQRRWLSVALIIAAPLYFDPPWLAWYDTELNEIYHLEAVTASGQTFNIPRTLLTPYEVYFAQNKFHFLSSDPFVNGRYGTTPIWEVARRLDGSPTKDLAETVRQELGESEQNDKKTAAFDRFLQRYFSNLNRRGISHTIPERLQPPQHIYSIVSEPRYHGQGPVVAVRVIHERALYQRDRIECLKREVLREIEIP